MHRLFIVVLVLLILTALPTIFQFGPLIEGNLNPVIDPGAKDVRLVKIGDTYRLYFKVDLEKYRTCAVDNLTWHWDLDGQNVPALVFWTDTNEQYRARTYAVAGRKYVGREIYSDVPPAAFSFPSFEFVGVLYYKCHVLWDLGYEIKVKVTNPDTYFDPKEVPTAQAVK